ncbi:MAG: LysE family translocator [Rhodobacteraceae bacterium]|jgi:threonine/homoserine/homoserine lactone efflux protein|nr:LysE family translocator [Paracoccaceae bacterium]
MTISAHELLLYAGGMALLWAIPGPVWVALVARALSGGMRGAWPLAVGVALGDLIWPLCAIFGLAWILSVYGEFLEVLRYVAAGVFVLMGVMLLRSPAEKPETDRRLTRPGLWAGFVVGVAAVIGNPKAILFYMGVLPGFFDLSHVTAPDIAAIIAVSAVVPMIGNLGLAFFLDRARRLLSSPRAMGRMNRVSGVLLILVGVAIPFT